MESERSSESAQQPNAANREAVSERAEQLEKDVLDLKILNGGKDFMIKQRREERDDFLRQLIEGSRRIGELESALRQLSQEYTIPNRRWRRAP